jgi:hypothetical protein
MIELVREKNQSVAALLAPEGMSEFFKDQAETMANQQ